MTTTKVKTIEIPLNELWDVQFHLWDDLPWDKEDARFRPLEIPYVYNVDFGNDIEVDIKVCNGDPPYVDAVLFDRGCEVTVCEPSDSLIGEYYLYDRDGNKFLVIVNPEGYVPKKLL